jgi:hypothetical protein
MIRIYLLFLLALCTKVSFGQDSGVMASLQVPGSSKLLIHTYAKGIQVYICTQDTKDTSSFTWILKEPFADLYSDSTYKQLVGKHYFTNGKNPTWENIDGSKVTGAKLVQVNSPDGIGIPWLLLKASLTTGSGILTQTIFIQRINTKGGKAPVLANRKLKGLSVKIPYTAEYLFYGKD